MTQIPQAHKKLFTTGEWYKDENDFYWRRKNVDGSNGMGDLIFNTMGKILYEGDTSRWAFNAWLACKILLMNRERWPDYMNDHPSVAKTRLSYYRARAHIFLKKFLRALKLTRLENWITPHWYNFPHRYQKKMTRDPYIAYYGVCAMFRRFQSVGNAKPPFFTGRPDFAMWRRYLITGKGYYLNLYRFFDGFSKPRKNYVIALNEIKEYAIKERMK